MIYDTGNPFDDMFTEDIHEDIHEHTTEEIETPVESELNQREGLSVTDILEKREDVKKYSNLIAYGVIGVVGLLILKRYM